MSLPTPRQRRLAALPLALLLAIAVLVHHAGGAPLPGPAAPTAPGCASCEPPPGSHHGHGPDGLLITCIAIAGVVLLTPRVTGALLRPGSLPADRARSLDAAAVAVHAPLRAPPPRPDLKRLCVSLR